MRVYLVTIGVLLSALPAAAQQQPLQPLHRPDDSPVVRATRGNAGMFFRFGGLATMNAVSPEVTVGAMVFNQVGVKFALTDRWMLPIFFGVGVNIHNPDAPGVDTNVDWGMMFGAGFEYHFRIWRRISPFVGAAVGFEFNDPAGEKNFRFATSLGPQLGVEYYWGDRVSLAAYYELRLGIIRLQEAYKDVVFQTAAGGGLVLTFYF